MLKLCYITFYDKNHEQKSVPSCYSDIKPGELPELKKEIPKMKTIVRHIAVLLLLFAPTSMASAADSFSTMSVGEVSAMLAQAGAGSVSTAASAKDAAVSAAGIQMPVSLNVRDMVTKIYGIISPDVSKQQCIDKVALLLQLVPDDDNGALWLENSNGYFIDYYSLMPEVSALARFDDDRVSDFGYFFLFPYSASGKRESISHQTGFCGALLQEMEDIGLPMDLNTATDDLFEAVGDYNGSFVDVRLLDEKNEGGDGRFILILSVEPGAFTAADDIVAEL